MQVGEPAVRGCVYRVAVVVVVAVVAEAAIEMLVLGGVRSRTAGSLSDRRERSKNRECGYQAAIPQSTARGELRVTHSVNIHEQPRSSCA
jgi:hypothetical protein